MKRSAACIRMLQLLKTRGVMSREELAQELEVNPRNISEYRKDLMEAGYNIESVTGKYGGYRIASGSLFPMVGLYEEEMKALSEADSYLKSHKDFLLQPAFHQAFEKIAASTTLKLEESGVYLEEGMSLLSKRVIHMISLFEDAKKQHLAIQLTYRSMRSSQSKTFIIHPYEIVNVKGSYYCIAYSLAAKDYRTYKFSEERMRKVELLSQSFVRDQDFRLQDHIGKSGLIKDEVYHLELLVYDESAILLSEKTIGIQSQSTWLDERTLHVKTMMEGKITAISFLLSLRNQCRLLAPQSLKEEMKELVKDMCTLYS